LADLAGEQVDLELADLVGGSCCGLLNVFNLYRSGNAIANILQYRRPRADLIKKLSSWSPLEFDLFPEFFDFS